MIKVLQQRKYRAAFTVAELVVVVVIVAALVILSSIGIGSWRMNVAKTAVNSDILALRASMDAVRNRTDAYPVFSPDTTFTRDGVASDVFVQSEHVEVTYREGDVSYYCVDFQSTTIEEVSMFLNTSGGNTEPQQGSC